MNRRDVFVSLALLSGIFAIGNCWRSKAKVTSDQVKVKDKEKLGKKYNDKRRSVKEDLDDDNIKFNSKSSNPSSFSCEICRDDKPTSVSFGILRCNHNSYCNECIGRYVASKLQENISAITCPVPGCEESLEPEHCGSILPKQVLDRWGDALCEALILSSYKCCYCPFKDCSGLLMVDNDCTRRESTCLYCNRVFCRECKVAWHSGMTCIEFNELGEDERASEDIMLMNLAEKRKWRRCPKCRFYIEKTFGCSSVKCRCGYSFCYDCGSRPREHYCLRGRYADH